MNKAVAEKLEGEGDRSESELRLIRVSRAMQRSPSRHTLDTIMCQGARLMDS